MKTKKKRFRVQLALLCAACFALGGGALMLSGEVVNAAEDSKISSYCPDGSTNISLGKAVTASSSYEKTDEGWSTTFLTDGKIGTPGVQPPNGWSTMPGETTDPLKIAWASIDLGGECNVTRIVLFPRNDQTYGESFPVNFQLQVSATGADGSWQDVKTFTNFQTPTEPLVVDVTEATTANYVRLYVTGRTGADNFTGGAHGNDGKLVQLCEMAVFGTVLHEAPKPVKLDRPALELAVGTSDKLKVTGLGEDAPALTWTSDDTSVVTVEPDGTVKAKAVGKTTVHVSGEGIEEQSCPITVVEKKYDFDENITISVFWLPTTTYLNGGEGDERWDEQFKLLADADIDWLANVTDNNNTGMLIHTKEDNLKAAAYAAKYGMHLTVADERFGTNLESMMDDQIKALIEEYRNVPGVGGYYIWDEPAPNKDLYDFARVYAAMKETDPNAYAHLNFLPMWAYTGGVWQTAEEPYRDHVGSWLDYTMKDFGVGQDFIMYDLYPYTGFGTGMMRDEFFSHLDVMRKIGLEYDVKTATYLQSNGSPGNKRSPSPSEIRYQAMTSLAYGYKQLSYFTWFLPTNRGNETFVDSIVSDQGVPNPKTYDAVAQLNKEIHALGKTLIGLDSLEVHLNGTQWGAQTEVPDDFIFQPMDAVDYTVSLMRDKHTGRNYVMLVNNDFTNPMQTSIFLNAPVSLQRVSPETGDLVDVQVSDQMLDISLEAGDAVLYALPEGVDFTEEHTVDKTAANAIIARAEAAMPNLSEADAAAVGAAVSELKAALKESFYSQEYIDGLVSNIKTLLDNAEGGGGNPDPNPPDNPGPDDPKPDDPNKPSGGGDASDDGGGGCGGTVFGGIAGGVAAVGMLLGAVLLIRSAKKKDE